MFNWPKQIPAWSFENFFTISKFGQLSCHLFGKVLPTLPVFCSFCDCLIVFVCLSRWCLGLDVVLFVSVPEFTYLLFFTFSIYLVKAWVYDFQNRRCIIQLGTHKRSVCSFVDFPRFQSKVPAEKTKGLCSLSRNIGRMLAPIQICEIVIPLYFADSHKDRILRVSVYQCY